MRSSDCVTTVTSRDLSVTQRVLGLDMPTTLTDSRPCSAGCSTTETNPETNLQEGLPQLKSRSKNIRISSTPIV